MRWVVVSDSRAARASSERVSSGRAGVKAPRTSIVRVLSERAGASCEVRGT